MELDSRKIEMFDLEVLRTNSTALVTAALMFWGLQKKMLVSNCPRSLPHNKGFSD